MAADAQDLLTLFSVDGLRDSAVSTWEPVYSVAPHTDAPVIRQRSVESGSAREMGLARWAFTPGWAKEGMPQPINARLETVAEKRMFSSAYKSGRVLVPMTGYYEWHPREECGRTVKIPYYLSGDGILAACGIMTNGSYAVLTRTGVDAAGEVHDRMPVFLPPAQWDVWLGPEGLGLPPEHWEESSRTEAAHISAREVGRRVNSVRGLDPKDPTLVEAV